MKALYVSAEVETDVDVRVDGESVLLALSELGDDELEEYGLMRIGPAAVCGRCSHSRLWHTSQGLCLDVGCHCRGGGR